MEIDARGVSDILEYSQENQITNTEQIDHLIQSEHKFRESKKQRMMKPAYIKEVMKMININDRSSISSIFTEYVEAGLNIPNALVEYVTINGTHGTYFIERYGEYMDTE